jgi:phosphohistidine phosphatase SixA
MSLHLYIMRHVEPEFGEPLDPTREITGVGRKQIADMARFMVREVGRVDLVISSWFRRAVQTADPMAEALGNARRENVPTLDPDGDPVMALEDIELLAGLYGAEHVLVVGHHPLINGLLENLCGVKSDEFHFKHGMIGHVDLDAKQLHWFIGPAQVEKDEGEVIDKAIAVAEAILSDMGLVLDEKKGDQGSYYYDTHGVKRWVLGDGGNSGNCDLCEENADEGWIDEDATYPNADEPPAHPNCTCTEETKEKRFRVYV